MKKGALFYKNYIEGYVLDACQLWPDKFDIKRKLFKESPLATVNNMDLFTSRTI